MFCEFGTEIGLLFFDLLAYHKLKLAAIIAGASGAIRIPKMSVVTGMRAIRKRIRKPRNSSVP